MAVIVDRRERVILEVQDNASSEMVRFAASVALARRELDGLNGSVGNVNARVGNINVGQANTNLSNFSRNADQASGSINQLTGRLGLLADGFLTLGPGLVPIAAIGVQAIGGLAAAATAAAVAGASAVVAFQGLGDAVTAVSEYQLDPTVAGLEKAQDAMAKLGPDAQRFVMEFQKFRPVLGDIKDAAAAGWFPGLTESLDGFAKLGPQIEDIFFKAGEAGGFIVDGVADSLASDRWTPFMDFLEREVPTAMGSLAQIMGDLGHGAAEMFMAFDPGNDRFLDWLEGVADGFDQWASSSRGQDAITDILQYAQTNGPALGEMFSSLVGTMAALVRAAAPIGTVVLPAITAVSDVIGAIADSDMATPIIAAVAAMRLYARVTAIAGAAQGRLATGQATSAVAASAASRAAAVNAAGLTGTALGSALYAPRPGSPGAPGTRPPSRFGTVAGAIGPTAVILAGAYAVSKAAAANNEFVDSALTMQNAINSLDFSSFAQGIDDVAAKQREMADRFSTDKDGWDELKQGLDPGYWKNSIEGALGDSDVEEAEKELASLQAQQDATAQATAGLGEAFGMALGPVDGSTKSFAELQKVLEAAKPAMDALGISSADYSKAVAQQATIDKGGMTGAALSAALGSSSPSDDLNASIADQARYMDSAQAKSDNYTAALGRLVREEGTAAERARGLNDALSALIDPANNAEAALDRYREALKGISELNAKGGFTAKTEVGRTNRAETRDFADSVKERLATMVEAGRTEEDVANALGRTREQFVKSGVAAGFSAEQMRRRATAIGLTPKLVETTFRELGVTKMDRAVSSLRDKLRDVPKSIRTEIRENGAIPTRARAMELIEKLNLVGKPRKALLSLVTEGEGNVAAAKRLIDSIRDKTATVTLYQRTFKSGPQPGADGGTMGVHGLHFDGGGTVPGMRYPYGDKTPTMLAPGEEVISNRNGQADRYRDILKAINDGVEFRGYANGGTVGGGSNASIGRDADDTARSLKGMRKALEESTAALAKERDQRRSLIDTVKSNFKSDPFATSDNPWGAGSNPLSALGMDIANLSQFQKLVNELGKRGLNGSAFSEVDTLQEAQTLAGLSPAELRRYEQLYNRRARLAIEVGGTYADRVGAKSSDIRELQNEVKRLRRDIKVAENRNLDNRDQNTDRATDGQRAAARAAARRRRRNRDT